jgi:alpha-tubulin suppressor-like RCC1 family protein
VARISGTTESDGRVIIVDETSGAVEFTEEVAAAGEYEANELATGDKIVLFRADNGETVGYSEVATVDSVLRTNVFACGSNAGYTLGDGTNESTSSLIAVALSASSETWVDIDPGNGFVIALRSDGTLWCWGSNSLGQLGLGDEEIRSFPTQIGTDTNWSKVSSGREHTVAIKSDGTLWSWGRNNLGQLGLGDSGGTEPGQHDIANRSTPTQIGTDTDWVLVSSGFWHSIAIKSNGQLWAWGNNQYGQLGLDSIEYKSTPTRVGSLTDWASVYTGYNHTFAKRTNGSLYSWGLDSAGQLGTPGVNEWLSTPTLIGSGYTEVAVGYDHTLVIKTDGTLWGTGHNGFGQLGVGDNAHKTTFTKSGTDTDWAQIVCTGYSSYALKTNGTLWSFGLNNSGQLGLGYVTDIPPSGESVPTQVGTASDWVKLMLPSQGQSLYVQNGGIEI